MRRNQLVIITPFVLSEVEGRVAGGVVWCTYFDKRSTNGVLAERSLGTGLGSC